MTQKDDHSSDSVEEATGSDPPCDPSQWLTVNEVALAVKLGHRLIRREIDAGRLKAARVGVGRSIRVHPDWVRSWMKQCAEPVEVKP